MFTRTSCAASRRARPGRLTSALLGALVVTLAPASRAVAAPGSLLQLPGTDACVSETGSAGLCADGVALDQAQGVAVSPDGRHVYVASFLSEAVAVFARDRQTNALTQLAGTAGCVSETGTGGACTDGFGLLRPVSVAVSKDGKNVYVASNYNSAVAVFARDKKTGALTQLPGTAGCLSSAATFGVCSYATGLLGITSVTVSPDGKHVYTAANSSDAVAVFARDKETGALTQLAGTAGCVSETGTGGGCTDGVALDVAASVAVSGDGRHVYVGSFVSDAVAVFTRDRTTGTLTQLAGSDACVSETGTGGACADGIGFDGTNSVAVSKDGKHVYVTSRNSASVAVLARDRRTGALTQLAGTDACVSETGTGGACADGVALASPSSVAVSPDGKNVYVASSLTDGVAAFARDKETGALAQLAGTDACVSEFGSGGACTDGAGVFGGLGVAVSRNNKRVYVAAGGSDAVAVFLRQKE